MLKTPQSPLSMPPLEKALAGDGVGTTSRVLSTIDQHHADTSNALDDYFNRNKSWLRKVFPTQIDKVRQDEQLRSAKTQSQMHQRIHALACAMRYEAMHETGEAWIKTVRIEVRGGFITVMTQRMADLRQTIEDRRQGFAAHIERRFKEVEKYAAMPTLQQRYLRSIDVEIEDEMTWLDDLLASFKSSVQEGLAQYEKRALPSS